MIGMNNKNFNQFEDTQATRSSVMVRPHTDQQTDKFGPKKLKLVSFTKKNS